MESRLTHLDERGQARMVDVGDKTATNRIAVARGLVRMQSATLAAIVDGGIPKGDVFAVARVAGIMAAKRTSELIPLCHPLPISSVSIRFEPDEVHSTVLVESTVRVTGNTGVEMEALTAVSIAGLTIYDMCKAIDRGISVDEVHLVEKRGGKSGTYRSDDA